MAANTNHTGHQQRLADAIYYGVGQAMQAQRNTVLWFQSIPTTQKFIVVGVFALIVIAIIYGVYMRSRLAAALSFDTAPAFMTDLSKLHNTKKPYEYRFANGRQVPYLPARLFPTYNNFQFTWSFWIYVNGFDPKGGSGNDWGSYRFGEWKHVMSHGSGDIQTQPDKLESLQYPGVWLHPKENNMSFILSVRDPNTKNVHVDLEDFPLNEWFHVTFVLNEMSVALYKNGRLLNTVMLPAAPRFKPNRNVFITNGPPNKDGGFAGGLYFLQFQNTVLSPEQIRLLYKEQKEAIDSADYTKDYDKYVKREFRVKNLSKDPSVKSGAGTGSSASQTYDKDLNTFKEKTEGWL